MKKPDSLRAKLTGLYPELARDPHRLRLWIEQGQIRSHDCGNLNFSLEYRLTVVIEGWTQPSILIWIALIDWLRIEQPELLTVANSKEALPFEADLISDKEADISFDLQLTENVITTRRADGGFDMKVLAEPNPLMPDTVPIIPDGEPLRSVWIDQVQVIPFDASPA